MVYLYRCGRRCRKCEKGKIFRNFKSGTCKDKKCRTEGSRPDRRLRGRLYCWGHPSGIVKNPNQIVVTDELRGILKWAKPDYIYTHNPFDVHDTHVAVLLRTLDALRRLSGEYMPEKVYGCEVWRSLDWLLPEDRIPIDVFASA